MIEIGFFGRLVSTRSRRWTSHPNAVCDGLRSAPFCQNLGCERPALDRYRWWQWQTWNSPSTKRM